MSCSSTPPFDSFVLPNKCDESTTRLTSPDIHESDVRLETSTGCCGTSSASHPSSTSLADHSVSIGRFVRNLEGTGCYDSAQVHLGSTNDQVQKQPLDYDVTVNLQEKKWYKLYIGGGVNSDDLSSLGSSSSTASGGATGAALSVLPKLQFETSASLLNLTGFADISSASYSVDQTGSSSFRFIHDRPLCSYLSKESGLYQWLMPKDPRTIIIESNESESETPPAETTLDEQQIYATDDAQYSLGGGSHTSLGLHATLHDVDDESFTRSSKEFVRSVSVRFANHARGAARGSGMSERDVDLGLFFRDGNVCHL